MKMNLNLSDLFKNVEVKKNSFPTRYIVLGLVIILMFYFMFTLNKVQKDNKEINCITYYTSLGYTASGCENIIERFVNNNE